MSKLDLFACMGCVLNVSWCCYYGGGDGGGSYFVVRSSNCICLLAWVVL